MEAGLYHGQPRAWRGVPASASRHRQLNMIDCVDLHAETMFSSGLTFYWVLMLFLRWRKVTEIPTALMLQPRFFVAVEHYDETTITQIVAPFKAVASILDQPIDHADNANVHKVVSSICVNERMLSSAKGKRDFGRSVTTGPRLLDLFRCKHSS